jgi:hypothetical protein
MDAPVVTRGTPHCLACPRCGDEINSLYEQASKLNTGEQIQCPLCERTFVLQQVDVSVTLAAMAPLCMPFASWGVAAVREGRKTANRWVAHVPADLVGHLPMPRGTHYGHVGDRFLVAGVREMELVPANDAARVNGGEPQLVEVEFRITRSVLDRLHRTNWEDCIKEGYPHVYDRTFDGIICADKPNPLDWYQAEWDKLHGPGELWKDNPLVHVIEFEPVAIPGTEHVPREEERRPTGWEG